MEVKILNQNNETIAVIAGRVDTVTSSDLENAVSQVWNLLEVIICFMVTPLVVRFMYQ